MLAHLADVSIRSLLLAFPAAIVLGILRRRRTAALQHAVWAAVVCGMLALFAFGQALPRLPLRILDRPGAVVQVTSASVVASPTMPDAALEASPFPAPARARRSIDWSNVVLYAYGFVALAFLARFATGMCLVRKLLANTHSIPCAGGLCDGKSSVETNLDAAGRNARATYESGRIAVPLTVGWLRPRILLPLEWREWDREKLDAVLAHEGAHVRRRDGLVAALAGVNRCLFWFHPLAWMLERKLALLAEQACDEYSVAALGDRERYAHLLLEMALVVDGSHGRLRSHALTMAAGSHIRQRIDSLLREGRTFSRGLAWTGWAAVALCGIPLVWGAGAVELDRRPPVPSLEMPGWKIPSPSLPAQRPDQSPVQLTQVRPTQPSPSPAVPMAQAPIQVAAPQLPVAPTPKFEVASIKPCKADNAPAEGRKGGGGGGSAGSSPGRLDLPCLPVRFFITLAYVIPSTRLSGGPPSLQIEGGPGWIDSERYQISAKAESPADKDMMNGPMLQALLEDRFQLKVHRETREIPVYALTVAKGGLKLQPAADGMCTPKDLFVRSPGQNPPCGIPRGRVGPRRVTLDLPSGSLAQFSQTLGGSGRLVIDKTGITEKFDFHLEYTPDGAEPSDEPDAAPSIFTALAQLGLKLEPAKGPRGFLVIDHVERPSEN